MSLIWPVRGVKPVVHTHGGRAFGATRADGKRYHAGIDINAKAGDIVVAPESGTIVATQRFNGPNAYALLIETISGVVLLGEVTPLSWREFDVDVGSTVERGQSVARVGINPKGSSMLHFELYSHGTRRNYPWLVGRPKPKELRDPTSYLVAAANGVIESEEHQETDATPIKQWGMAVLLALAVGIGIGVIKW